MTSLESETLLKMEKIKAKAAIAVAVINNISSAGIISISDSKANKLYEVIKEAQKTID